jgi:hypothetical protein
MDRASSMHGDLEKLKDHLGDVGMDGRIMLVDKMDHRK